MNGNWDFIRFKKEFFQLTGLDLERYKDKQMERRIGQLIEREGYDGLRSFFNDLKVNDDLLHKFYNYLTINTSVFYRDTKIYDYLQDRVLPDLLKNFNRLKVWSMGCSHGEEPYSIALMLHSLSSLNRAEIVASDIDDKALDMAREGKYSSNQLEKVPKDILKTAFTAKNGFYFLDSDFKKAVTFKKHNLLESSLYKNLSPMQLILCRNVFIYFKIEVQEWIVEQVSKLVAPGGYFIIGCAEFINKPERFNLERLIPSIYKKTG